MKTIACIFMLALSLGIGLQRQAASMLDSGGSGVNNALDDYKVGM